MNQEGQPKEQHIIEQAPADEQGQEQEREEALPLPDDLFNAYVEANARFPQHAIGIGMTSLYGSATFADLSRLGELNTYQATDAQVTKVVDKMRGLHKRYGITTEHDDVEGERGLEKLRARIKQVLDTIVANNNKNLRWLAKKLHQDMHEEEIEVDDLGEYALSERGGMVVSALKQALDISADFLRSDVVQEWSKGYREMHLESEFSGMDGLGQVGLAAPKITELANMLAAHLSEHASLSPKIINLITMKADRERLAAGIQAEQEKRKKSGTKSE